ncbi:hypothetical protein GCM10011344_23480 [Dokdonia pacifica]|uniref:Uncharacterized protein n=1 Tax=Dokdonia pacifica TaxID=1627892 RepID=A0A238WKG1_9FLAO|nr:hypothetical protein [Dokdonia pacifica]GGG22020.1 hypothetical protein GCM10011344_23480 [Dokdonia pacifica]SNR47076.1 hypothetical protein SAMN06265376_1011178 [Dokdonia pacifica]
MTREEHLQFCKKCTNRELDMEQGLLCSLTKRKADFEGECRDYNYDETVLEQMDDTEALDRQVAMARVSEKALEKYRSEQNLPAAIGTGVLVGFIGALLWAAITVATGYQIGYMAIAIGAGVGISMRIFGKGMDQIFGISGAIIAIVSCLLGNYFSLVGSIANYENLGYFETFSLINLSEIIPMMKETFSGMDLFFYAIAGYEGYKFAFRAFTEKELAEEA